MSDPSVSPMLMMPTVRALSRVTVRLPVMLKVKFAVAPAPSAILPPSHLVVSLQLPSESAFHEPFVAKLGLAASATVAKAATKNFVRRPLVRFLTLAQLPAKPLHTDEQTRAQGHHRHSRWFRNDRDRARSSKRAVGIGEAGAVDTRSLCNSIDS